MSRSAPVQTNMTFKAFLAAEQRSQERHEFVDGHLFLMPGANKRHNRIVMAIVGYTIHAVQKQRFDVFSSDTLVRTPDDHGYYPDFFIVCDTTDNHPYVSKCPAMIIEVLSDSTEAIDRGEKWHNYQKIPSLQRYGLLSQRLSYAEVYVRQDDGSWRYQSLGEDGVLEFPMLELALPLGEIYGNLPSETEG
jgi:Uma2 family endonuclease